MFTWYLRLLQTYLKSHNLRPFDWHIGPWYILMVKVTPIPTADISRMVTGQTLLHVFQLNIKLHVGYRLVYLDI